MNVSDMQRKLGTWAVQDKERKFVDLYKLLLDEEWLKTAHDHVKRNRGSITAGTDGITMSDFDTDEEDNLSQLRESLRSGTFQPFPVRRVLIHEQKPDGRQKQRKLGIPAIRDRIVQEALRMILEPIFEADFVNRSYGFRPNRCTMDAVNYLWQRLVSRTSHYFWIIEGDIASYFDTINHRNLMRCLKRRIKDKRLLNLVFSFLRAGLMEKKLFRDTLYGAPQGGILSPLLANVYLHELDQYMEQYTALTPYQRRIRRRQGQANFLYVRYCDDFIVLCDGTKAQAQAMRQELYQFLMSRLKLNLSLEKTKVTHINDGFGFLGFWLQRRTGSKGKQIVKILIPEATQRKYLHKIQQALSPSTHQESVSTKIKALNRIVSGWGHYYQYTSSPKAVFHKLDYKVFWLVAHWLGRKYQCSIPQVLRRFRRQGTLGTATVTLAPLGAISTKRYKARIIPNPYTTSPVEPLRREVIFSLDSQWVGTERRPGQADWRDLVLERDGAICTRCGTVYPEWELELDHIKPRGSFRRPFEANYLENFQLLCTSHHRTKTKTDRQVLSRVR